MTKREYYSHCRGRARLVDKKVIKKTIRVYYCPGCGTLQILDEETEES